MGFFLAALLGLPLFAMIFAGPALLLTFRGQGSLYRRAAWSFAAWLLLAVPLILTWSRHVPMVACIGPSWSIYLAWLLVGRRHRDPGVPAWRYFAPVAATLALLIWMAVGAVI